MSYNYVTVTYTFTGEAGSDGEGRVYWYPTGQVTDSSLHEDVTPPAQSIILDDTGSFSATLLACDNANLSDFGWVFHAYVGAELGLPLYTVTYEVAYANGSSQTLDALPIWTG
jgi:hypothetical protein